MLIRDLLETDSSDEMASVDPDEPVADQFFKSKNEIVEWLYNMHITNHSYHKIDDEWWVDIDGDVQLNNKNLKFLPVRFRNVNGTFNCGFNPNLTSLKGAPVKVEISFSVTNNYGLTSLQYSPKHVGGSFFARSCHLSNLVGAPEYVGDNFNASSSDLLSLKGSPKRVGGSYLVNDNRLKSLEGITPFIGKNVGVNKNWITTFKDAHKMIKQMGGDLDISDNHLITECLVPIMLIKGLDRILTLPVKHKMSDKGDLYKALKILSNFESVKDITDIQNQLIDNDLEQFAGV